MQRLIQARVGFENNHLIAPNKAKHQARPLIKKIEVEIIIAEQFYLLAQFRILIFQRVQPFLQKCFIGLQIIPAAPTALALRGLHGQSGNRQQQQKARQEAAKAQRRLPNGAA